MRKAILALDRIDISSKLDHKDLDFFAFIGVAMSITNSLVNSLLKPLAVPFLGGVSLSDKIAALSPLTMYSTTDLSSIFTTSTGETNVASVNDPVGLVLDKSQMGGKTAAQFIADQPELLINNDFDSGLNGWTVTNASPPSYQITVSGGILHFEAAGSSPLLRLEALSLSMTTGNYYVLEVDVAELNSGTLKFDMDGDSPEVVNKVGINRFIFKADRDYLRFYRQSNPVDIKIASISLKEIPGQHLVQETSSQRLLYQADGSLLFDGVDDKLEASVSGFTDECTVALDFVYQGGSGGYDWFFSLNNGGGVSSTEIGFFIHENKSLGIFNKLSNGASSSTNDIGFGAVNIGDRVTLVMSANGSNIITSVYKNKIFINEVTHTTSVGLPALSRLLLGTSASGAEFGGDRVGGNFGRTVVFADYLDETQRALVAQWMLEV